MAGTQLAGTLIPPLTGVDDGVCRAGTETMPLAAEISLSAQSSRTFFIFASNIQAHLNNMNNDKTQRIYQELGGNK